MHEISGVEYVYSISSPGQSLVIVRFKVGTPEQDALVKVYSKLYSNADRTPVGTFSIHSLKVHSIDDVPILALTLWGEPITTATNCGRLQKRCSTTIPAGAGMCRKRS